MSNTPPINDMNLDESDPAKWQGIYEQEGTPGWDIAQPAPPFISLTKTPPEWLKKGRLLNVGCGFGHDAYWFAKAGWDVTAVDFAAKPIASLKAKATAKGRANLTPLQADLFNLPSELNGQFDYVLEHTCFCAINPSRRSEYALSVAKLLKPGGVLFGLFYRFDEENDGKGPPHWMNMDTVEQIFGEQFELIANYFPEDSLNKRRGRERLLALRKK